MIFKGGTEVEVSYIFAALASGTVVGSLLYAKFSVIRSPSALMKWWMAYGAVFILLACTINLSITLSYVISFVLGGCGAFVDISIVSLIQALSGKQDIGKNFGLFSTLANTGEAASGLIYGFCACRDICVIYHDGFADINLRHADVTQHGAWRVSEIARLHRREPFRRSRSLIFINLRFPVSEPQTVVQIFSFHRNSFTLLCIRRFRQFY